MMEYASFDFRQFGVENSVCTLEDFHFVDDELEFNSFADVMSKCAKDIVTGLQHLHHMHIQGQKKQVKVGGGGGSGFQGTFS